MPLAVPAISATKRYTPTADSDIDGKADPGDALRYTVVIRNTGSDATGVAFNDTIDANTTLVPGSVISSPLAIADGYNAIGNVQIVIAAPGVLGNDLVNGGTLSADATSANGGIVAMNADGSFSYNPPPASRAPTRSHIG